MRDSSAIQYLIEEYDFGGLADHELAPDYSSYAYRRPILDTRTQYILALLSEEAAEIIKLAAGKSFCFGFDKPAKMKEGEPDFSTTPEAKLHDKAGDMLAAIEMAFRYGILERNRVMQAKIDKIITLVNGRDDMGRPLAPSLPPLPIFGDDGEIWEPEGATTRQMIAFSKDTDGRHNVVNVFRTAIPDPNKNSVKENSWWRLFNWMRRSKIQNVSDF
jgi:hypothetical protein